MNDDECTALVQRSRRTSSVWWRTPSERRRTGQNCYFFSARVVRRAGVTGALHKFDDFLHIRIQTQTIVTLLRSGKYISSDIEILSLHFINVNTYQSCQCTILS